MTTLVLLPGMDGTGDLFTGFVAALGSGVKTQIVRYPGREVLSYPQLAEVARASIPADGPYVLLGESFSGPVAIALAAENPAHLQGLVLCCSFASSPRPSLRSAASALLRWPVPRPPMPLLSAALLGASSTPALRAALKGAVAQVGPHVLRSRLAQAMRVDVTARLRQVQVPLLYLRATRDRLVPLRAAREIERLRPAMQLVSLPGPHGLLQAQPAECAMVIQRFLAGRTSVSSDPAPEALMRPSRFSPRCSCCARSAADIEVSQVSGSWHLRYSGPGGSNGSGDRISAERAEAICGAFVPPYEPLRIKAAGFHDSAGFCIECGKFYCPAHWNVSSTGFGRCPAGHGKSLDPHWSPAWDDD